MSATQALATASKFFEDFTPRTTFDSPSTVITLEDIRKGASLFRDYNAIHYAREAAVARGFQDVVAPGILVLGIASGLAGQVEGFASCLPVFRGITDWTFCNVPVYPGDEITARLVVRGVDTLKNYPCGKVTFAVQVKNQNNRVIGDGKWELLVPKKPAATT